MRIDSFLFNGEIDMLELRLSILDPIIDRFVIVESTVEFSGRSKPLYFQENKNRFLQWKDKIYYYPILDTPDSGTNRWAREYHQRNAIIRGLEGSKSNDVVFMGDLDEIPDLEAVKANKRGGYQQVYSLYYVNAICTETSWVGTTALYYFQCQQLGIQNVRNSRHSFQIINPGGWHFAYLMTPEQIHHKLGAFAHLEWDTPETHAALDERVAKLMDPFGAHKKPMEVRNVSNGYFPEYLKNNQEKYAHLIKQ